MVETWVGSELAVIFFQQADADQRHGYEAGQFVSSFSPGKTELVMAAVLHDIGKRHSGLGVIGRSVASILILLRIPLPAKMRLYRDHGDIGASELELLGAPTVVADFTRHHHGSPPSGFDLEAWKLLQDADQPPKARTRAVPPITSQD